VCGCSNLHGSYKRFFAARKLSLSLSDYLIDRLLNV
jgi:hypothetical protein